MTLDITMSKRTRSDFINAKVDRQLPSPEAMYPATRSGTPEELTELRVSQTAEIEAVGHALGYSERDIADAASPKELTSAVPEDSRQKRETPGGDLDNHEI
jgi:hypothetical protein